MLQSQAHKAATFRALHVPGDPVILFNVWDAGSTAAVVAAGARAVATGSWSVANALGYSDGEQVPFELVIENLKRVVASTELPVTADLETGYGVTPDEVARSIAAALEAGAIGFNIEDGLLGGGRRAVAEQADRFRAVRMAADGAGVPAFVNARTDVFLQSPIEDHAAGLGEALDRALAYAEAGADGLFVPGLSDLGLIEEVCAKAPLPVNIMSSSLTPSRQELASVGVARISYGPGPFALAMAALEEAARAAIAR